MNVSQSPPPSAGRADLATIVDRAKTHGIADGFLVSLLRSNGFAERDVYRAFSAHYRSALGLPERAERADAARDAFQFVVNFLLLGAWTIALGNAFYRLIDRAFPDPGYGRYGLGAFEITWDLATIIVAFPIFVAIDRVIARGLRAREDLAESGVRRWLTYGALSVATCVVLGDGVWFVYALLSGGLSTAFSLRSATLLVIGGGCFGYYLLGLRRREVTA